MAACLEPPGGGGAAGGWEAGAGLLQGFVQVRMKSELGGGWEDAGKEVGSQPSRTRMTGTWGLTTDWVMLIHVHLGPC